jgi:hypothetical protein
VIVLVEQRHRAAEKLTGNGFAVDGVRIAQRLDEGEQQIGDVGGELRGDEGSRGPSGEEGSRGNGRGA